MDAQHPVFIRAGGPEAQLLVGGNRCDPIPVGRKCGRVHFALVALQRSDETCLDLPEIEDSPIPVEKQDELSVGAESGAVDPSAVWKLLQQLRGGEIPDLDALEAAAIASRCPSGE